MKILFVDDMDSRHESFNYQLDHYEDKLGAVHDVVCVYSGDEALKIIAAENFDVMFLDHDLADVHYAEHLLDDPHVLESPEISGTDLAIAVALLPLNRQPSNVVIHSWNRHGAKRMRGIISTAPGKMRAIECKFNDNILSQVLSLIISSN